MATALDSPAAAPPEKPPGPGDGAGPDKEPREAAQRTCANCGAPLKDDQDWCLQCGAATPGSLSSGAPGRRLAALVLGTTLLLAFGAAAAAYAAWGPESGASHNTLVKIARAPAPQTTTPATPATPAIPKAATPLAGKIPIKPTPTPPPATATTPAVPPAAALPKSSSPPPIPSSSAPKKTTSSPKPTSTGTSSASSEEAQPSSITLDTNAAATYNPYGYPASEFGDPSLAIDGDPSTAWTARVNPAVAPRMAEGLVIDLKSSQRLSSLSLLTSSPGMTVQVYGANGRAAPASITDSAWSKLSPAQVVQGRQTSIKLAHSSQGFRFVTLWISRAPASSVGTAKSPGHVSVNELELFPAG
jgi:hypothetical protein